MELTTETVNDIEIRSRQLLQKIDDVTADLYSLGGLEERIAFMNKFKELLAEKNASGDLLAVDVLNWALERLAEAD